MIPEPCPTTPASEPASKKPPRPLPSPKKKKASRPNDDDEKNKGKDSEYPTPLDIQKLKVWWKKYERPRVGDGKVPGLVFDCCSTLEGLYNSVCWPIFVASYHGAYTEAGVSDAANPDQQDITPPSEEVKDTFN